MRFVIKPENDQTTLLASPDTYKSLLKIIKTKDKSLISDSIYRESYETPDGKRSKVEDQLALSYKNKCAYCERLCKADIEHYRPKKKVANDNSHPGYYWLCYEWSNLLPSCITCNREGAKHNEFPIIGPRVYTPTILSDGNLNLNLSKAYNDPLKAELPFLLHPEVDNPDEYFSFELDPNGEGIRLIGIDPDGRGKQTIDICLLNRKEVKLDRVYCVIDDFKDAIHCTFIKLENSKISELEFRDQVIHHLQLLKQYSLNEEKTHTLLRKHIIASSSNFEEIVIPFLETKIRNIVLEAYKSIEP